MNAGRGVICEWKSPCRIILKQCKHVCQLKNVSELPLLEPGRTLSVHVNEPQSAAAESTLVKAVGLAGAVGRWLLLFPGRLQVGMADSSCKQTQCGSATC